jgi:hypothetical protein
LRVSPTYCAIPVVGLRLYRDFGITLSNLAVHNALNTGIQLGLEVCHKMSLSAVRILVDRDVIALPESRGLPCTWPTKLHSRRHHHRR